MINASKLIHELKKIDVDFFSGVPDSLMSDFSKSLHFDYKNENHIIATSEGSALGLAMGHNLATGKVPLIYMQNSGLGNFINPYTSLLHSSVYKIPFVLLVGWRGEIGVSDEPQHGFQGKITLDLLELLEINYIVIDSETTIDEIIYKTKKYITDGKVFAIVVRKGTFEKDNRIFDTQDYLPKRKEALKKIVSIFSKETLFISTTGKLSRELYEIRKNSNEECNDLYVVGGMGHASAISAGMLNKVKEKTIVCLDGDGSVLMHMGSLATLANIKTKKFFHIIFNNSAHESVGGQPTIYNMLDTKKLYSALGYKKVIEIENLDDIDKLDVLNTQSHILIQINVQNSSDKNLMRPDKSPQENKFSFVKKINE